MSSSDQVLDLSSYYRGSSSELSLFSITAPESDFSGVVVDWAAGAGEAATGAAVAGAAVVVAGATAAASFG
jgi:predicted RNA methylase